MSRRASLVCLLFVSTTSFAADGAPLPEGALMRLGSVRLRPGGMVSHLAFSPDGTKVASWCRVHGIGSYLCTWDAKTGRLLRRVEVPGVILEELTWGNDGRGIALLRTGWDRKVHRVWEFTDEKTPSFNGQLQPGMHLALGPGNAGVRASVYDSAFAVSADGKTIAIGASGQEAKSRSIVLHPLKPGRVEALPGGTRLALQPGNCWQMLFTPDGKRLVALSEPKVVAGPKWDDTQLVVVWDVSTGKEVSRFVAPRPAENGRLAVAASNRALAIGMENGDVSTWDLATAKERRLAAKADGRQAVLAVAFTPDGKTLVSGGWDGLVKAWDVATGKHVRNMETTQSLVEALAVSPDGRTIAAAGQEGVIRLWDTATGKDVCPHEGHTYRVAKVALTPDGKTAITLGLDRTIRWWDTATGRERSKANLSNFGWGMALSPDGRGVVTGMHGGRLQTWDVATGRETTPADLPRDLRGSAFAFTPDGSRVIAAAKARVSVLEWPGMKVVRTIDLPKPAKSPGDTECRSLAVSPDGRWVLTTAWRNDSGMVQDGVADLWDVATGKRVRRLVETSTHVQFATFTPNGHVVLAVYRTATIPAEGGRPAETFEGGIVLIDPAAARVVRSFLPTAPGGRVGKRDQGARFVGESLLSPDGRTLYVSYNSGEIVALEVATGQPRRAFDGPRDTINDLAISRDGRRLVTGGQDGTALVWDVSLRGTARPLTAADADVLWAKVASTTDARAAFEAMAVLVAVPERAVEVVRREVKPVPPTPSDADLDRLFEDLDSEVFATREKATRELNRHGESVVPRVRERMERSTSLEVRRRVKPFLDQFAAKQVSPTRLLQVRAVELLEGIGSPAAKALLAELAKGGAGAPLTLDAAAALARLDRR